MFPPHKLSSVYRGPLQITAKVRDDIFPLRDLITGKISDFHIDRLRIFKSVLPETSLLPFGAADKDEYVVESIVEHRGSFKASIVCNSEFVGKVMKLLKTRGCLGRKSKT